MIQHVKWRRGIPIGQDQETANTPDQQCFVCSKSSPASNKCTHTHRAVDNYIILISPQCATSHLYHAPRSHTVRPCSVS